MKNWRLFKVPKNSYGLTTGDSEWLESNIDQSSLFLIKGLLKRRFNNIDLRRYNQKKIASVARKFIKKNKSLYKISINGKNYLKEFEKIPNKDVEKIILSFRDVIRGFTENDILHEKKYLQKDKKRFISIVEKHKKKNEILKRLAVRKGMDFRIEKFSRNIQNLKMLKKKIEKDFTNLERCARSRCHSITFQNRRGFQGFSLLWVENIELDYLNIGLYIELFSALRIIYPLKFLYSFPITTLKQLYKIWSKDQSKEKIVQLLESEIESDNFFKKMLDIIEKYTLSIFKSRKPFFKEIQYLYQNGYYPSSTLLSITQLEGMIWDFGCFLNRKRKFIFKIDKTKSKPKYHPYKWNKRTKEYENVGIHGYPIHDNNINLNSARHLLKITRLREFLPEPIVAYFIDEFYDERNSITHGNIEFLNKTSANYALLLLFSFLDNIGDHRNLEFGGLFDLKNPTHFSDIYDLFEQRLKSH